MHKRRGWSNYATSAAFPLKKQQTFWASLPQQSNVTGSSQKPGSMGKFKGIIDTRRESNPQATSLLSFSTKPSAVAAAPNALNIIARVKREARRPWLKKNS